MATPRVFCRLRLLINNKFSVISKNNIVRNSVFLNKNIQVQVVRQLRTHVGSGVILDKNKPEGEEQEPSSSSSDDSDSDDDDIVHTGRSLPTQMWSNNVKEQNGKRK